MFRQVHARTPEEEEICVAAQCRLLDVDVSSSPGMHPGLPPPGFVVGWASFERNWVLVQSWTSACVVPVAHIERDRVSKEQLGKRRSIGNDTPLCKR